MTLFVVRTTTGRERQVVDRIYSKLKTETESGVKAIFNPLDVRGYIFIEANDRDDVMRTISHITHIKGIVKSAISMNEIEHFFEPVSKPVNIHEDDIVEIISGPFKGEKARVTQVNQTKEECVVELLEAAVSIPITQKLDAVKVIRRDTEEGAQSS